MRYSYRKLLGSTEVLFIMMYKVILNFDSVYENLMCNHSNVSY